jgi:hypothetical protein
MCFFFTPYLIANSMLERLVETLGKAKADAVINVIKNKQPEMLCDAKNWIIVTGILIN